MTNFRNIMVMTILSSLLAACAGERRNLGARDGLLAACPASPNCVSSQAGDAQHRIAPFSISGDPDTAFARLAELLKGRHDTTIVEVTENYLRVELRTTFFTDDGEFLLDRERRVIQVRSASRLGYSDFGKNRRRMEEIRREFEEAEKRLFPSMRSIRWGVLCAGRGIGRV